MCYSQYYTTKLRIWHFKFHFTSRHFHRSTNTISTCSLSKSRTERPEYVAQIWCTYLPFCWISTSQIHQPKCSTQITDGQPVAFKPANDGIIINSHAWSFNAATDSASVHKHNTVTRVGFKTSATTQNLHWICKHMLLPTNIPDDVNFIRGDETYSGLLKRSSRMPKHYGK